MVKLRDFGNGFKWRVGFLKLCVTHGDVCVKGEVERANVNIISDFIEDIFK